MKKQDNPWSFKKYLISLLRNTQGSLFFYDFIDSVYNVQRVADHDPFWNTVKEASLESDMLGHRVQLLLDDIVPSEELFLSPGGTI